MATEWLSTSKPSFLAQSLALTSRESHQVLKKISLLLQDPTPDAKTKKFLKYVGQRQVYRLRSGDFRIFIYAGTPLCQPSRFRSGDDETYDLSCRDTSAGPIRLAISIARENRRFARQWCGHLCQRRLPKHCFPSFAYHLSIAID